MKTYASLLCLMLLTGCVAVSGNLEQRKNIESGDPYFVIGMEVSYPAKKFISPEEWIEFHKLPGHQKTMVYEYYKEREEIEENWARIIEDCLLRLTIDC